MQIGLRFPGERLIEVAEEYLPHRAVAELDTWPSKRDRIPGSDCQPSLTFRMKLPLLSFHVPDGLLDPFQHKFIYFTPLAICR